VLKLVSLLRVPVAAALLILGLLEFDPPLIGFRYPDLFTIAALVYLLASAGTALLAVQGKQPSGAIAAAQIIIDIVAITLLVHASGGVRSGIAGLLAIFVAAAGLSLPKRFAYLGAAVAALAILGEQALSFSQGVTETGDFVQAGLLGTIMLTIAFGTQPLLRRIEESEALAHQRGIDLADLAQLNDYIIQNLRESIVVVDADSRIRLLNQSAADLLNTGNRDNSAALKIVAPQLYTLLHDWRNNAIGTEQPGFLSADSSTYINVHIAPLGPDNNGPVLLFLEDASLLTEKVQQSKLAALGRLSASIAHEIRNPVGALSHAGQLLAESPGIGDEEQRFIDIIQKNSKRVSGIVDNVLQLSRKEVANPEQISLNEWCNEFVSEFTSTLELNEGELSIVESDIDVLVRMDPSHLHQVAWNLCENAVKYASQAAGGIAVEMHIGRRPNNRRPFLDIKDHGEGVPEQLRDNLFEPFATGREGGTGLGLYICRELCEQNKATLRYLSGDTEGGQGSTFQIVFADPNRWDM